MRYSFVYNLWVFSEKFNWGKAWKKDAPQMCMVPWPGMETRLNKEEKGKVSREPVFPFLCFLVIGNICTILVLCLHLLCHGRLYSAGLLSESSSFKLLLCQVLGHSHEKNKLTQLRKIICFPKEKKAQGRRARETGRSVGRDCYERTPVA